MVWLIFSFKLDLGSYIVCIAETACEKMRAVVGFMKFLSSKVALYLYKLSGLVLLTPTWNC